MSYARIHSGPRAHGRKNKESTMSATDNGGSDVHDRTLGSVPGALALARGPAPDAKFSRHEYDHPTVG
jgi:hypothetical protein